jgi:hypothetical protein
VLRRLVGAHDAGALRKLPRPHSCSTIGATPSARASNRRKQRFEVEHEARGACANKRGSPAQLMTVFARIW